MYIYRNPNPCKSLVGDCVVRAISLAEKKNWDIVFWDLCDKAFSMCDMPSSNEVWGTYLQELGYKCYPLQQFFYNGYSVKEFCNDYNTGTYILGTGSHAVAVENTSSSATPGTTPAPAINVQNANLTVSRIA